MKKFYSALFIVFIACGKPQLTEVKDPLLYKKALEQGNSISSKAQQALGSNLMRELNTNGTLHALEFCNIAAYPLLDTLDTDLAVTIKRAAIKARNQNDLPTTYEKEIINKYELAVKNKLPLEPIIQTLGKDEILYAAPIQTKNNMCLKCHGSENDHINKATLKKINELYPNDNATGHRIGDVRGIWSIKFNRLELLNYQPKKEVTLDGLQLLKQNCYSCHSPTSKNHDHIIAPPLAGVKRRYLSVYKTEEMFKKEMISFLKEPTKEKAIMKGPVNRFGVMPKFQWSKEVIEEMVNYIYANELEQPEWFEAHYQEKHSKN